MASSLHGLEPVEDCPRWCKHKNEYITILRPTVVSRYNASMGGVDLCDQTISYHRLTARCKRWPVRVIMHLLDLAVNNCWLIHRAANPANKSVQLFDYRFLMGEQLLATAGESTCSATDDDETRRRKVPVPLPINCSRSRRAKHLPEFMKLTNSALQTVLAAGREFCSYKTSVRCTKCNVFLCINANRNCFLLFHKK